jgi:hypothetical protein
MFSIHAGQGLDVGRTEQPKKGASQKVENISWDGSSVGIGMM